MATHRPLYACDADAGLYPPRFCTAGQSPWEACADIIARHHGARVVTWHCGYRETITRPERVLCRVQVRRGDPECIVVGNAHCTDSDAPDDRDQDVDMRGHGLPCGAI